MQEPSGPFSSNNACHNVKSDVTFVERKTVYGSGKDQ